MARGVVHCLQFLPVDGGNRVEGGLRHGFHASYAPCQIHGAGIALHPFCHHTSDMVGVGILQISVISHKVERASVLQQGQVGGMAVLQGGRAVLHTFHIAHQISRFGPQPPIVLLSARIGLVLLYLLHLALQGFPKGIGRHLVEGVVVNPSFVKTHLLKVGQRTLKLDDSFGGEGLLVNLCVGAYAGCLVHVDGDLIARNHQHAELLERIGGCHRGQIGTAGFNLVAVFCETEKPVVRKTVVQSEHRCVVPGLCAVVPVHVKSVPCLSVLGSDGGQGFVLVVGVGCGLAQGKWVMLAVQTDALRIEVRLFRLHKIEDLYLLVERLKLRAHGVVLPCVVFRGVERLAAHHLPFGALEDGGLGHPIGFSPTGKVGFCR